MSAYRVTCPKLGCGGWGKKLLYRDGRPIGYECHRGHRWDWRTGEDVIDDPKLVLETGR